MPSGFVTAFGRKSSALHLATPVRRSQSSQVLHPAAEDETFAMGATRSSPSHDAMMVDAWWRPTMSADCLDIRSVS